MLRHSGEWDVDDITECSCFILLSFCMPVYYFPLFCRYGGHVWLQVVLTSTQINFQSVNSRQCLELILQTLSGVHMRKRVLTLYTSSTQRVSSHSSTAAWEWPLSGKTNIWTTVFRPFSIWLIIILVCFPFTTQPYWHLPWSVNQSWGGKLAVQMSLTIDFWSHLLCCYESMCATVLSGTQKNFFLLLITLTPLQISHLTRTDKMSMLLTGISGAAEERCEQRREQVLLGKGGLLLHHRERCPGGHTLELLGCQLVIKVQEVEYLDNKYNRKTTYIVPS